MACTQSNVVENAMNKTKVSSIVIVGGGSAGWMTAIYLNKYFNDVQRHVTITVIESPDIGIIGVGEATVTSIRLFFAAMGIDEFELMNETNATFKEGVMFRNWKKPVDGHVHEYFHPFEPQIQGGRLDISTCWFLSERRLKQRYDEAVCLSSHMLKAHKGPKSKNCRHYGGIVPYGYHIDATLMSRFLRRKAVEAGITHIEATVNNVLSEKDHIQFVETNCGRYTADIFVDCTGFQGLLIEKLRNNNWVSFEDALPCNKAVAIQKPYTDDTNPRPYTLATALSNGWAWQIGLTNREGLGYVYDGNRISPDEAEKELREFAEVEDKTIHAKHLDVKVGCREEFWIGNCLAIGLSGGFIEPLESTGLHVINIGAKLAATHLSTAHITPSVRASYSRAMSGVYADLKQFIVLHYCLTDRDDTEFWRQASQTAKCCPGLTEKLQLWKHKVCEYLDLAGGFATTFTDENYRYVLYGMGHHPELSLELDAAEEEVVFSHVDMLVEQAVSAAMIHQEYLVKIKR